MLLMGRRKKTARPTAAALDKEEDSITWEGIGDTNTENHF